ncbi:nucleotidyltransferase [Alkalibacterium psychrotolerans]
MKACGIVAEYNPFHNGHAYQLEEARKQTGADVIIVVMSGNFLQRGEPAIIDKWSRAELALKAGADLVVELPVDFSVQPADFFAEGAVAILNALGCDVISFGSELGNSEAFKQAAEDYLENEQTINETFKSQMKQSEHYAKNFSRVLKGLYKDFPVDLSQPNNVLGFSYAKEITRNQYPMLLHTVKRLHSDYHEDSLNPSLAIGSATAIRKVLNDQSQDWGRVKSYVPKETFEMLQSEKLVTWDDLFPYLRYQITLQSVSNLLDIYLMEEGLQYRIKEKIGEAASMTEFLERLKTKQLTWTRLQRICYHILMNNKKADMKFRQQKISTVRLLGFNSNGQKYMNENKDKFGVTIVSNIRKKQADMFYEDIRAGLVYRLASVNEIKHQDYYRKPVKLIDK